MADSSDVEIALREQVQAVRTVSFPGVAVVRGWPSDDDLNAAASANGAIVAVTQRPGGFQRLSPHYLDTEVALPSTPPSLTVSIAVNAATFLGTCSTDQIAGLKATSGEWAVRCGAADTPATIAAALAALSGGSATGATVTVSGLVAAATERDQPMQLATRQQSEQFQIGIWTAAPDKRDQIASAIDAALSGMTFLTLADGSMGRITWAGSIPTDKGRGETVYRRDLFYLVDYATTIGTTYPCVLFADWDINGLSPGALAQLVPVVL